MASIFKYFYYTDDIRLLPQGVMDLGQMILDFQKKVGRFGLKKSTNKTRVNRSSPFPISDNGRTIAGFDQSAYLDSIISADNGI